MDEKQKKSPKGPAIKRLSTIIVRVTGSDKLNQLPDKGVESVTRLIGYLTSYTSNLPGEMDGGRDQRISNWGSFPKFTELDNYCLTAFSSPLKGDSANDRVGSLIKKLIEWKVLDTDGIFILEDNETPPSGYTNGSQQEKSVNEERIYETMENTNTNQNTTENTTVMTNADTKHNTTFDDLQKGAKDLTGESSPVVPGSTDAKANENLASASSKSTSSKSEGKPIVSRAGQEAINEIIKETTNNRIAFSQNARVKVIGYTQIGVASRIEASSKENGVFVGTVANASSALEKFKTALGYHEEEVDVQDESNPKAAPKKQLVKMFDNLAHSNEKWMAEKIYDLLVQACDADSGKTVLDPQTKKDVPCKSPLIQVYTGNYSDENPMPKSIKGIEYTYNDVTKVLPWSDVKKLLINDSMSFIDVEGLNDCQLRLQEPKAKSGARKLTHSVKISQRKELNERTEIMVPVKSVNKENHSVKGGLKSEYSVKYLTNNLDDKGNRKTMTYRIPLKAEQYEIVVSEQYKDMFKTVSNEVAPIKLPDVNDQEQIAILQKLVAGAMSEDATNLNRENTDKFKELEKKAQEANARDASADVGDEDLDPDMGDDAE